MSREQKIAQLLGAREIMKEYLLLKLREEDWHGVQDAGSDLRDIESELAGLEFVSQAE